MKTTPCFFSQPNYLSRTAIEAEILFAVCVIEKQALTGGKSLACEDKYSKKIGAKSAVLNFVFFVMLKNKIEQSAAQSCLKNNLLLNRSTERTFENRWSRYKELGKKVPQAYRVYVEDTFLPCDAGDARIFSKEHEHGLKVSKHIFVGNSRLVTAMTHADNNGDTTEQTEKRYYYHADHLQSAQFITNVRGEQYEHIEYTPYGELWIEETAPGIDKLPFRFTGKELDEETGLYYYGARYLDPKYSRWLSGDPALGEYVSKDYYGASGGIYNTANLSVYHYGGNNPITYTDPDGMEIRAIGEDGNTYIWDDEKNDFYNKHTREYGTEDEFINSVKDNFIYLKESSYAKDIIKSVSQAKNIATIKKSRVTRYSIPRFFASKNINIFYDPDLVYFINDGTGSYGSPDTALFHEICHAYGHLVEYKLQERSKDKSVGYKWHNAEEYNAVQMTNRAAIQLGEPIRNDYISARLFPKSFKENPALPKFKNNQ